MYLTAGIPVGNPKSSLLSLCVTAGRSEPVRTIPREVIVRMYVVRTAVGVAWEECVDDEGKQPEDDHAKD